MWIIKPGLEINEQDLTWQYTRAGGPGGQHVNVTDSAVILKFRIDGVSPLTNRWRRQLRHLAGKRVNQEGFLVLRADQHRERERNRQLACDRLAVWLIEASKPPPRKRIATKPSRAARQKRLDSKKTRGNIKKNRGRVDDDR